MGRGKRVHGGLSPRSPVEALSSQARSPGDGPRASAAEALAGGASESQRARGRPDGARRGGASPLGAGSGWAPPVCKRGVRGEAGRGLSPSLWGLGGVRHRLLLAEDFVGLLAHAGLAPTSEGGPQELLQRRRRGAELAGRREPYAPLVERLLKTATAHSREHLQGLRVLLGRRVLSSVRPQAADGWRVGQGSGAEGPEELGGPLRGGGGGGP